MRGRWSRYGLTRKDLADMYLSQGGSCAICARQFQLEKLCIDHEHVRGWKASSPGERAAAVRGLLCRRCNWRVATKQITLPLARGLVAYLEMHARG